MSIWLWVLLIVLVLVLLGGILIYNRLVALRARVDNGWSQIDVQLRRRYDLIPNLVKTVQGYATHEREVFENVTEARARAIDANAVPDQANAENQVTRGLRQLMAVAENYPELKANENFLALQEELRQTVERTIASLPEELRTAIMLREIDGLSYEEIAQAMDCPVGTVRSRIFRAREAIDRSIGSMGGSMGKVMDAFVASRTRRHAMPITRARRSPRCPGRRRCTSSRARSAPCAVATRAGASS